MFLFIIKAWALDFLAKNVKSYNPLSVYFTSINMSTLHSLQEKLVSLSLKRMMKSKNVLNTSTSVQKMLLDFWPMKNTDLEALKMLLL